MHEKNRPNRLKELRESKGLTQEDVAELLEIHPSSYKRYEKSERELSASALHILEVFYNQPANHIMMWDSSDEYNVNLKQRADEFRRTRKYVRGFADYRLIVAISIVIIITIIMVNIASEFIHK